MCIPFFVLLVIFLNFKDTFNKSHLKLIDSFAINQLTALLEIQEKLF